MDRFQFQFSAFWWAGDRYVEFLRMSGRPWHSVVFSWVRSTSSRRRFSYNALISDRNNLLFTNPNITTNTTNQTPFDLEYWSDIYSTRKLTDMDVFSFLSGSFDLFASAIFIQHFWSQTGTNYCLQIWTLSRRRQSKPHSIRSTGAIFIRHESWPIFIIFVEET